MGAIPVALGGAVGALGRYGLSLLPLRTELPVLTLVTNLLGALLIGFLTGLAERREGLSPQAMLFWKTGVCGGFTTFSTFSLEAFQLLERRAYAWAGAYMACSVAGCLAGVLAGKRLAALL